MPEKWYMTDFEEWACREAYHIVALSDVPCHLWLRWSLNQPWKHDRAREFRGLPVMGDVYYCFNAYHDVEQDEAGDTLEHTFTMSPWLSSVPWKADVSVFDMNVPPYWEKWGTALDDHHPWYEILTPDGSYVSIENNRLTLFNDAWASEKIRSPLSDFPLVNELRHPLSFAQHLTGIDHDPVYGWFSMLLKTEKDGEEFILEPVLSRGSSWGKWGSVWTIHPDVPLFIFDYGNNVKPMSLLQKWIAGRKLAGLDTDPSGWKLTEISLLNEQSGSSVPQTLVNDHLHLFYQPPPEKLLRSKIRYFYFWGEVAGQFSPSQSAIFCRMIYFTRRNYSGRPEHEDDTVLVTSGGITRNPPAPPYQGYVGTFPVAGYTWGTGIRWRDFQLPRCAEILSAWLWVSAWLDPDTIPVHARISAEYTASPADFYDISRPEFMVRYATRVGIVDWNDLPPFVSGHYYKAPSLLGTIQSAVSHPGWTHASRLVLFLEDFDARTPPAIFAFRAFRLWWPGIFNPPLLEIEYNHWQIARRKVF